MRSSLISKSKKRWRNENVAMRRDFYSGGKFDTDISDGLIK
jgi:hypothetical protein